jgi:hypothetical protein
LEPNRIAEPGEACEKRIENMRQPSNLRGISHGELVELADRLMSEMSDERFLPAYDAALAADNDAPLVKFCGQLLADRAPTCGSKRSAVPVFAGSITEATPRRFLRV